MTSWEKAYSEGREASHNGYGLSRNPYKRFTNEWEEWKQGWEDDRKDDPYWAMCRKINRKGRLSRLNFKGFSEVKSRLEVIKMILECELNDKEKIELLRNHIEKSLSDFLEENKHLVV